MAVEPCRVCGSALTAEARYCSYCGAAIGVDVVEVARGPEQSQTRDEGRRGSRVLVVLAVAVVAALVGVVLFTGGDEPVDEAAAPTRPSPDPTAMPSPEPTALPEVEEPTAEVGIAGALTWDGGSVLGSGTALLAAEVDDEFVVLAAPDAWDVPSGLVGWSSSDGMTWDALGQLISPDHVAYDATAGDGWILVATADPDGRAVVWVSTDGRSWSPYQLPDQELSAAGAVRITAMAAVDDGLIVATREDRNPIEFVRARWPELEDLPRRFGFSTSGSPFELTITGPLGIPLASISAADLDMSESEAAEAFFFGSPGPATVWTTDDGSQWESSVLERGLIDSISADPTGGLVASGWTGTGPRLYRSDDGVSWEEASGRAQAVQNWGDRLVGYDTNGRLGELVDDGFRPFGVERLVQGRDVHTSGFSSAEPGLVAVLRKWEGEDDGFAGGRTALLVSGDYTLTADLSTSSLTLTGPDGSALVETTLFDPARLASMTADLPTQTVTFTDPDTGAPLASFSLDELAQLEEAIHGGPVFGRSSDTIAFTTDGTQWFTTTVRSFAGPEATVGRTALGASRIVALISDQEALWGDGPNEIVVWTASHMEP